MSHKQGVKRSGKGYNADYISRIQAQQDYEYRYANSCGKVTEQDMFLLALGRLGYLGPKRNPQLHQMLKQVRHDYAEVCAEDGKTDKELWYTKAKVDAELKQYLGADNFQDWDTRYSMDWYSDGIRCFDITDQKKAEAAHE